MINIQEIIATRMAHYNAMAVLEKRMREIDAEIKRLNVKFLDKKESDITIKNQIEKLKLEHMSVETRRDIEFKEWFRLDEQIKLLEKQNINTKAR